MQSLRQRSGAGNTMQANDEKCSGLGWVSTPLAVDSYGAWGKEASLFFAQVAARLAIHKSLPKSQSSFYLFSNLSFCLIRANARAFSDECTPYLSVFDVYFMCMEKNIYFSLR